MTDSIYIPSAKVWQDDTSENLTYTGPSTVETPAGSSFSTPKGTRGEIADTLSLNASQPLNSFRNLLQFFATSSIKILDPNDFEFEDEAGTDCNVKRGSSMEVRPGTFNGKAVALKRLRLPNLGGLDELSAQNAIDKYQNIMYDILFELKVMSHEPLCRHRNIVRAFGVTFDEKVGADGSEDAILADLINPIIVVELAYPEFPDLVSLFAVMDETFFDYSFLAGLASDVADGIAILHDYGIVHSDIKPGNILIFDDGETLVAKIGDFGAAGLEAAEEESRGFTKDWAAPECLGELYDTLPGLKLQRFRKPHDIYSFGLVLGYIMLRGRFPIRIEPGSEFHNILVPKAEDVVDELVFSDIQSLWTTDEQLQQTVMLDEKLSSIKSILERTLRLHPGARLTDLNDMREKLTGSDAFAQQREEFKYTRRDFVERHGSLLGKAVHKRAFDHIEIEQKYSVLPHLPAFLAPLLHRAGLGDSVNAKYYPRCLLEDQPIAALGKAEDAMQETDNAEEAALREALSHQWEDKYGPEIEPQAAQVLPPAALTHGSPFDQIVGFPSPHVFAYVSMICRFRASQDWDGPMSFLKLYQLLLNAKHLGIFNWRDPNYKYKTLLHAACHYRDRETAQFLINNGADINITDENGSTPIMQVLLEGFTFFKEKGEGPKWNTLHEVPAEIVLEMADFLISNGARIEPEDPSGKPLMARIGSFHHNANKPKIIDFLVRHGCPFDDYDPNVGSPLVVAALSRHTESVRRLLRLGANPNVNIPRLGFDNVNPRIKAFLENSHKRTLLEGVAMEAVRNPYDEPGAEIFELLLAHGAEAYPRKNQIGWSANSPMGHVFILRGRTDLLRILLKYRPGFVHSRDGAGHSLVQQAVYTRELEAVQLCIDNGADLDARSVDGTVPCHAAFAYMHGVHGNPQKVLESGLYEKGMEIVNVLGAYGADLTKRRNWPFAPPTRLFLENDSGDEPSTYGFAYTVADDSFINNWKLWSIRYNLDERIANCGSAAFLLPTIWDKTGIEIMIPVVGHSGGRIQSPMKYQLAVRFGIVDSKYKPPVLVISKVGGRGDRSGKNGEKENDIAPMGCLDMSGLATNQCYEAVFDEPFMVEDDYTYIIMVTFHPRKDHQGEPTAVAGLYIDWFELRPFPLDASAVCDGDRETRPSMPGVALTREGSIADVVPTGIKKLMEGSEPVVVEGKNRPFKPLPSASEGFSVESMSQAISQIKIPYHSCI